MAKRQNLHKSKIKHSYRVLIVVFAAAAALLVLVIVYFSFSKTIIEVEPASLPQTESLTLQIVSNPTPDQSAETIVPGQIYETTEELTKVFTDLTATSTAPAKATGKVIIYNKQSKTQPLVAGTRLLTDAGMLFRTDQRVDITPGGKVETTVTADQAGKNGEIGPSRFTLPGIWPGLRDKVYAESTEAMIGGTKSVTIASRDDIEKAKQTAFGECYSKALDALESALKSTNADQEIQTVKKEIISELVSVEPDTETASFEVTTKIHVVGLTYDSRRVETYSLEQARDNAPTYLTFTPDPNEPFTTEITQYDTQQRTAVLRITIKGTKSVNLSHPMFDRSNLTNRDKSEIQRYFAQYSEVSGARVHFSPFWLFRTPALADHIEIRLTAPKY